MDTWKLRELLSINYYSSTLSMLPNYAEVQTLILLCGDPDGIFYVHTQPNTLGPNF